MPIYCRRRPAVLRLLMLVCALAVALIATMTGVSKAQSGSSLWQVRAGLDSDDPLTRADAALAAGRNNLTELGSQIAKLCRADPDAGVRLAAVRALTGFDPPPSEASASLILALADPDEAVRGAAAALRPSLKSRTDAEIAYLVPLLSHGTPDVRATAALAISDFSVNAKPYLPQIEKLYQDPEPSVRKAAQDAAEAVLRPAIHSYTGGNGDRWLAQIGDPDPAVRMKSIAGLAATGDTVGTPGGSGQAVDALIGCFSDADAKIRYRAAWALLDLAPRIPVLREKVRQRLYDPSPQVRQMARYTLEWMPGEAGTEP